MESRFSIQNIIGRLYFLLTIEFIISTYYTLITLLTLKFVFFYLIKLKVYSLNYHYVINNILFIYMPINLFNFDECDFKYN